jgi:LysM repeat protein
MAKSGVMKLFAINLGALIAIAGLASSLSAQSMARSPAPANSSLSQLEILIKKVDEQNAKIDMLSQQILKLEQQLSNSNSNSSSTSNSSSPNARPGVMIGEGTATGASSTVSPSADSSAHPANGNEHTVARGETLTSIAKMHGTTVSELQKLNHIENPLKLQIGQTIALPGSASPAPSASPGE